MSSKQQKKTWLVECLLLCGGFVGRAGKVQTATGRELKRAAKIFRYSFKKIDALKECPANIGFSSADQLWGSLQGRMATKINENGGAAKVVAPTISRPDYQLVKDVIEGKISIETFKQKIGCK